MEIPFHPSPPDTLRLFEGYGVEIEYMIVQKESLSVAPVAEILLHNERGETVNERERGDISWSNELTAHLVELKTTGPSPTLTGVADSFVRSLSEIRTVLEPEGYLLLPTAMHPWMDPRRETVLWPHENREIYEAFDRIFHCQGHGWSNLQSVHINLPFADDEEFARLHAAIRLVLPLLPALAASSPLVEGNITGVLDNRLAYYRTNAAKIPSVSGHIIPEPVFTRQQYQEEILENIYRDLAPRDPGGILREEWVNARGAIARFDRNAIEIRLLDVQENPFADLAVVHFVVEWIRSLVEEHTVPFRLQREFSTEELKEILVRAIQEGERAPVHNRNYEALFGLPAGEHTLGDLLRRVTWKLPAPPEARVAGALERILEQGPLARRILRSLEPHSNTSPPSRELLREIYLRLARSLRRGEPFEA